MKIKIIAIVLFVLFLACGSALSATEAETNKNRESSDHNLTTTTTNNSIQNSVARSSPGLADSPIPVQQNPNDSTKLDQNKHDHDNSLEKYTQWLTYSTIALVVVTTLLCWVTWGLKRVADNDFSATHRPRIIVHTMGNIGRTEDEIIPRFTYVNTGGSVAKVTEISTSVFFAETLRPGTDLKPHKFNPIKLIEPGERSTFEAPSGFSQKKSILSEMKKDRGQCNENLFCVGVVSYENAVGAKMETGFIRRFDGGSNIWLKVNNSDYEYSY